MHTSLRPIRFQARVRLRTNVETGFAHGPFAPERVVGAAPSGAGSESKGVIRSHERNSVRVTAVSPTAIFVLEDPDFPPGFPSRSYSVVTSVDPKGSCS